MHLSTFHWRTLDLTCLGSHCLTEVHECVAYFQFRHKAQADTFEERERGMIWRDAQESRRSILPLGMAAFNLNSRGNVSHYLGVGLEANGTNKNYFEIEEEEQQSLREASPPTSLSKRIVKVWWNELSRWCPLQWSWTHRTPRLWKYLQLIGYQMRT